MTKHGLLFISLVVSSTVVDWSQSVRAQAQASTPSFEVASVRSNRTGDLAQRIQPSQGRLTVTNVSLRGLVRFAYELQDFQVDGGPNWFAGDRWDIAATTNGDTPVAEVRLRLRTLLADRFKLRTHTETRDQPIYALVIARSDGRLGPSLRAATEPSNFFGPAPGLPITAGRLAFRGMTLEAFARSLAPIVRRTVVDRTGLSGYFDAEFDASAELPPPPPPPGSGIQNPFDPQNMPSIFTVLQDQLGLKLESTRAVVPVLVVDGAERATDN